MSPNSSEKIKTYWEEKAKDNRLEDWRVTSPDLNQRMLENGIIRQWLPRQCRVLDIGCGNGFSTAFFSQYVDSIVGIDYSQSMIARARQKFSHIPHLSFFVADVMNLEFLPNTFDAVLSQRCLINLESWKAQQAAISNIAEVLKPGGLFLLQEGTQQGRARLNKVREMFGLIRMPEVAHNCDFDENLLWPFLKKSFDLIQIRRFGLYDLISRVIHPLQVKPAEPVYEAKINEVAREISEKLEGCDDMSREFSACLRRLYPDPQI